MTRVVVVGAGPAGLAAAEAALWAGAKVTVLDQSDAPGGQYHRKLFGVRQPGFEELLARCDWWPESTVWALEATAAGDAGAGDRKAVDPVTAARAHAAAGDPVTAARAANTSGT